MNRERKNIYALVLLSIILISLCALGVSGASVLISEIVSRESTDSSIEPAMDISSGGVIGAVWSDDTDLGAALGAGNTSESNGPDRDIFFNYRPDRLWSSRTLSGNKIVGGVKVISNSSMTSSIQPDIDIDSNDIAHIVWSGLTPPPQLSADNSTTFLHHFNANASVADYAEGNATANFTGDRVSLSSNAIINGSVKLEGANSYLEFLATDNINLTLGTIEFWFNPLLRDFQHRPGDITDPHSVIFTLHNSSNSAKNLYFAVRGGHRPLFTLIRSNRVVLESELSFIYPIRKNEWHHAAFTYNLSNSSSSELKIYLDGYLVGRNVTNITAPFDVLTLGSSFTSANAYAMIDEFMISDTIRTDDEIKQHAGNRSIFYRNITNATEPSPHIQLTQGVNQSYYPRIVSDSDNNLHLVYNELYNKSSVTVMYMMRNSTGWSEPELVSNGTSLAYMPDIAVDQNKTAHVVWEEFSNYDRNISYIHYEKKNLTGSWHSEENVSNASYNSFAHLSFTSRTIISNYFPKKPRIIVDSNNITKVVWADNINYPDPKLTFYASFDDDNFNATYARGSPDVEASEAYPARGHEGSYLNKDFFLTRTAVNISNKSATPASHLNYSTASNFNITKGAISMWFKPSFDPSNTSANITKVLFSTSPNIVDNSQNKIIIEFFNFAGYGTLSMLFFDKYYHETLDITSNLYAYSVSDIDLPQDTWHYLGFSWQLNNSNGEREVNISIDGVLQQTAASSPDNTNPIPINETQSQFFIGAAHNVTIGYINLSDGLIDEVKIYNSTRTAAQFYGDTFNDYDIFYRQKEGTQWSDIILVSNESNYMSLNPSIGELGTTYISWSQAEGACNLASSSFTHCALFRVVAALYNDTIQQVGTINEESTSEAFYPEVRLYSDNIYYIWEDNSNFAGSDIDIQFRETKNSTRPVINITSELDDQVFTVTNFSAESQNISLNATATDSDSTISNVTFYYTPDGVVGDIACIDYDSPYSCEWNIINVAEDLYRMKAIVTSSDGERVSDINDDYFYIDSSPGVVTYAPDSSGDNKAYEKGYENWTSSSRPNVTNGSLGDELSSLENISRPDNVFTATNEPPSCEEQDFINSQVVNFYITEDSSDIKSLDIYWSGIGYTGTGYLTNLSIWNFNTSGWESLAFKDFTMDEKDTLRYTITSNINHYFEPDNNSIFVLIETQDYKARTCGLSFSIPCPIYSSWNGSDYIFEAEGLLGQLNRQMESTTYDRLNQVAEDNGKIKVMISEVVPEILYLDQAELIAVDHPLGTEIYADAEGNPHTIRRDELKSVLCRDMFGDDCSSLIEKEDEKPLRPSSSLEGGLVSSRSNTDPPPIEYTGNAWVSDIKSIDLGKETEDYLYLTLPESNGASTAKLLISGSDTGLMSFSEYSIFALGKDNLPLVYSAIDNTIFGRIMEEKIMGSARLTIQVLDEDGKWVDYPETFENAILGAYKTILLPLETSLIKDNQIRIRMTAFAYMIDYIGIDYSADEPVSLSYSKPGIEKLDEIDGSRYVLPEGEHIELVFDAPEKTPGMSRTYLLATTGYYHPLESLVSGQKEGYLLGDIDIMKALAATPLYAIMYADSSYAKRYLIENYLNTDFDDVLAHAKKSIEEIKQKNAGQKGMGEKKHNTLYSDLIKITVSTCAVPSNNMEVTSDTILCRGIYQRPDYDFTEGSDKIGILRITGSDLTLNCNSSVISGGGLKQFQQQKGAGVGIGVNFSSNIVIKDCMIEGYEFGIGMNGSSNITIINSSISYTDVGIGGENTNNSYIHNVTLNLSGLVGISIIGNSMNNTIDNNTLVDNFVGIILESGSNNSIINNVINAISNPQLAGIGLTKSSNYNRIDNNLINNYYFGLGMADIGKYLTGQSSGKSGVWNNFSRNTINNSIFAGIGLLFPYNEDYLNYFEQSNTVGGEPVYYLVNQHGTLSNYTNINNLTLTLNDTSLFTGKITIVNSSYLNISNNTLANNFYNILLVNSSDILISGNLLENGSDMLGLYEGFKLGGVKIEGGPAGVGLHMIFSEGITVSNNIAQRNRFGYITMNKSENISFTNNKAFNNSVMGFYTPSMNQSNMVNNNASGNVVYGMNLYDTANSTIRDNYISGSYYGLTLNYSGGNFENNTAVSNTVAGFLLYNCRDPAYFIGNTVENNLGDGIMIKSCTSGSYSGLSSNNNSRAGLHLVNSQSIFLSNVESNKSRWGVLFNNTNNTRITGLYAANNTDAQIIFLSSQGNSMIDSVIVNNLSAEDINSSSSWDNSLLNTSFNRSNAVYEDSASNLSVRWHLDFYVQDNDSYVFAESIPITGVNITTRDTNGGNELSLFTDDAGYIYFNASEYVENSTGRRYFSNYTWNVTKLGYNFTANQIRPHITTTNMSENRFLNLSMVVEGGFEDTDPPTDPIVVDGPDYVDIDWFSSRTTLSASWYNSTDRHLIFYTFRILENGSCLVGYCQETSVWQNTTVTVGDLNLTEGMNYTFAVRARDSYFWYTPFIYSDGAIADFTLPNVTVNSTTHPDQSASYNNVNATLTFYGNDSMSGIDSFSYILDQNSGTGPDLIEEPRPTDILAEMNNNGHHSVLKANSTGDAFAVYSLVNGNLSVGDNLTVTFQLSEDVSDRTDIMYAKVYLVPSSENIDKYDETPQRASTIAILSKDITHKNYAAADIYSANIIATDPIGGSFYIAVAGLNTDDDNTNNLSISGADSGIDNTTAAYVCGESSGCTDVTNTADYAIAIKREMNSTVWTKTYNNLPSGSNYFHVRAKDIAGNWGEAAHYRIHIDSVEGAPVFVNIKPRGYIATTTPTLAVDVNEYSTCLYNTTGSDQIKMTSYDGIHHEAGLSLPEGNYTYGFNCTDSSGNSAFNSTTFIIDPDALPDTVTIWPMTNYTAGQRISVNVNVTKNYLGVPYGLGELADRFSANITNSTPSKIGTPLKVTDKGDGLYTIEFTAPLIAGTYTLSVGVAGVTDTESFVINSYTLTIRYTGATDVAVSKNRMAFGTSGDDYAVGVAADTEPTSIMGTTAQLEIKFIGAYGNGFIFITTPIADIEGKSTYLDKGTFLDLKNPSFGQDINQEEHVVSTILDYDTLHIGGSEKVYGGRYSILIRNDGVNASSGKTKLTISII